MKHQRNIRAPGALYGIYSTAKAFEEWRHHTVYIYIYIIIYIYIMLLLCASTALLQYTATTHDHLDSCRFASV